jgi:hypothetical protein
VEITPSIEPAEARPGETVTYKVTFKLAPGLHVYQLGKAGAQADGPMPTSFDLFDTGTLRPSKAWKASREPIAKSEPAFGDAVITEYFEDEVTWSLDLWVPADARPGKQVIRSQARYMICNQNACFPPTAQTLPAVVVNIVGDGAAAKPAAPAPAQSPLAAAPGPAPVLPPSVAPGGDAAPAPTPAPATPAVPATEPILPPPAAPVPDAAPAAAPAPRTPMRPPSPDVAPAEALPVPTPEAPAPATHTPPPSLLPSTTNGEGSIMRDAARLGGTDPLAALVLERRDRSSVREIEALLQNLYKRQQRNDALMEKGVISHDEAVVPTELARVLVARLREMEDEFKMARVETVRIKDLTIDARERSRRLRKQLQEPESSRDKEELQEDVTRLSKRYDSLVDEYDAKERELRNAEFRFRDAARLIEWSESHFKELKFAE